MPPRCEKQQPTFRVKFHVPATTWHPHTDRVIEVKKPTEWEAWAHTIRETLAVLTGGSPPLILGYMLDLINQLPADMRTGLITGIAQGLGLDIRPGEEPNTIVVTLVPRYDPLVGDKKTESGLVLPQEGQGAGLVLPGQQGFGERK